MAESPVTETFPAPAPDADSKPFWEAANEGVFLLQRCDACGGAQFYFRAVCHRCGSTLLRHERSAGKGTIATFSIVHRAPVNCFRQWGAYPVALVDLDEGVRFLTNVVRCEPSQVRIGQRVQVVFEAIPEARQKLPKVVLL
jgi:uncharacterized protein